MCSVIAKHLAPDFRVKLYDAICVSMHLYAFVFAPRVVKASLQKRLLQRNADNPVIQASHRVLQVDAGGKNIECLRDSHDSLVLASVRHASRAHDVIATKAKPDSVDPLIAFEMRVNKVKCVSHRLVL